MAERTAHAAALRVRVIRPVRMCQVKEKRKKEREQKKREEEERKRNGDGN